MRKKKEYAVYKGDEIIAVGNVDEIAKQLNVTKRSVYFWKSPTNHKRNNTSTANRKVAYVLEDDNEEEVM